MEVGVRPLAALRGTLREEARPCMTKDVARDARREPAWTEGAWWGEAVRGSRRGGRIGHGPTRIGAAGIDAPAAWRREGRHRRLAAYVIGGQPAAAKRSRVEGAERAGPGNA
ncbi:protein of unknown function [Burkholderia multivorans]